MSTFSIVDTPDDNYNRNDDNNNRQDKLFTICPCLRDPKLWRYLGEGFEAIIFEFLPPPSTYNCPLAAEEKRILSITTPLQSPPQSLSHQNSPGPSIQSTPPPTPTFLEQSLPDPTSPTITISADTETTHIHYLCIDSLTDLVLRVPKIPPLPLSAFTAGLSVAIQQAPFINTEGNTPIVPDPITTNSSHNDPTHHNTSNNKSLIHDYFYFKEHIIAHMLPQQLIPHEIPLILSIQFVATLFQSIILTRPPKRQREFNIESTIQNWKDNEPNGDLQFSLQFTQCLLMQDFTKHRLLHRLGPHHHPYSHDNPNHDDLRQLQQPQQQQQQYTKITMPTDPQLGPEHQSTPAVIELDDIDTRLVSELQTGGSMGDADDENRIPPGLSSTQMIKIQDQTQSNPSPFNTPTQTGYIATTSMKTAITMPTTSTTAIDSNPTHYIHSWGDITVAYEIKPKWGYTRRSQAIPIRNNVNKSLKRLFGDQQSPQQQDNPQHDSLNNLNNGKKLRTTVALMKVIQKVFFFHFCRTCALRTQREMVSHGNHTHTTSKDDKQTMEKRIKPPFCPLDLYSIAHFHHHCPHHTDTKPDTDISARSTQSESKHGSTCNECRVDNEAIKSRLHKAVIALFATKSSNLVCSTHITQPFAIPPLTKPDTEALSQPQPQHQYPQLQTNLSSLLTTILLSTPLTKFFHQIQLAQFLLDPTGPSFDVYKGCTCRQIPTCAKTGKKMYSKQIAPPLPLWESCVKSRIGQPLASPSVPSPPSWRHTPTRSYKLHSPKCLNRSPSTSLQEPTCSSTISTLSPANQSNQTNYTATPPHSRPPSTTSLTPSDIIIMNSSQHSTTVSNDDPIPPTGDHDDDPDDNHTHLLPFIPQLSMTCSRSLDALKLSDLIPHSTQLAQDQTMTCSDSHEPADDNSPDNHHHGTDLPNPLDHAMNNQPACCDACVSRICLTASMTIKDLSVYISTTPVFILAHNPDRSSDADDHKSDQNKPFDQQRQYVTLFHHEIPILTSANHLDPTNPAKLPLSRLGYFLLPIEQSSGQIGDQSRVSPQLPPPVKQLLIDLKSSITTATTQHIVQPLYPFSQQQQQPGLGPEQLKHPNHPGYNYYLCRLQCGDIGQKKYSKYKSYILQEQDIIGTCIKQLFENQ